MKPKTVPLFSIVCVSAALLVSPASADPMYEHLDGLFFDNLSSSYIIPWDSGVGGSRKTIEMAASGGFLIYSNADESSPMVYDGGITMLGNPISLVLSSNNPNSFQDADFNVWSVGAYSSYGVPLLNINGHTGDTTFTDSDVIINNGTLTVGGSPVVTSSILTSGGYVNTSNFNSTLSAATPPTSSGWKAAYVPRGNVSPVGGSTGGLLALGNATASGEHSLASGDLSIASGNLSTSIGANSTASGSSSLAVGSELTASGNYSVAMGATSIASGAYSLASGANCEATTHYTTARGLTAIANGMASTAFGWGATATARTETALGNWNLTSTPATATEINGLNGLLRVGNGTSTTLRSDALTVLRNGQTTLTNKEWKTAVVSAPGNAATALADPASTTDSSGNALVVDGHAVLNGKVTLAVPQGDISMGDYQ